MAIRPLDDKECLELLARVPIGRIAGTFAALPVIFPVNFCLFDDVVVFGAMAASTVARVTDGLVVAFEADAYDHLTRTGWTVVGVGRSERVETADLPIPPEQLPEPWVLGDRAHHLMQLRLSQLSGHAIA